jgi:hypothetical protein
MPATVLNRYRNSIGHIFGVYQIGFATSVRRCGRGCRAQGFVVGDGLVATNRHMAEPW